MKKFFYQSNFIVALVILKKLSGLMQPAARQLQTQLGPSHEPHYWREGTNVKPKIHDGIFENVCWRMQSKPLWILASHGRSHVMLLVQFSDQPPNAYLKSPKNIIASMFVSSNRQDSRHWCTIWSNPITCSASLKDCGKINSQRWARRMVPLAVYSTSCVQRLAWWSFFSNWSRIRAVAKQMAKNESQKMPRNVGICPWSQQWISNISLLLQLFPTLPIVKRKECSPR